MKSICLFVTILSLNVVLSQKCPRIQSVVNLKPSATASNFTHAVIAEGKYYLLSQKVSDSDEFRTPVEPSGDMPLGFEDSRLTVVIDGTDCAHFHYYLLTIKSFPNEKFWRIFYSTLDLMDWNPTTKWSDPKSIWDYPLLANDPYLRLVTQISPDLAIEDFIQTIFYSHKLKTLFFVTKPIGKGSSSPPKSTSLRYYSARVLNPCDKICQYSKRAENLSLALNSVIEPLDLCFFDENEPEGVNPLIYCFGGNSFKMNAIVSRLRSGFLRTVTIGSPHRLPTIDRLKVVGRLCSADEFPVDGKRIGMRMGVIEKSSVTVIENMIQPKDGFDNGSTGEGTTTEKPVMDNQMIILIVIVIGVALLSLIVLVLVISSRKQQRIAKM